jgi:hypothetical protein
MPDYQFNTQLGPTTKPMSLGDMLNLAGGIQSFQQAQQMNPLLLRQQQLATQKAEALTPEEIQTGAVKAQEERKRQPIETSSKQLEQDKAIGSLAIQIIGGVGTDPRILNAAQDPKAARDALIQTASVMVSSGIPEASAQKFLAPIMAVVEREPDKLPQIMKNLSAMGTTSESQTGRATPQLVSGPGGAPTLFTSGTGTVSQPRIQQNQPQQMQPQGQPQGTELPMVGGVRLSYPVRRAGDINPLAPSEAADAKLQQEHRQALIERRRSLTAAERVSEEVIKKAEELEKEAYFSKGGVVGNLERKLRMYAQSEKYDALAKELANQTIQNAKVLGISDSVSGLNMSDAANGTIKVPPEVLIQVARRNRANQTEIDLQAAAKNSFAQQFGDNNGATFDQIWRNNSESSLYEAMAIDKSRMSYQEKQKAYKKLFEGMSAADLADFKRKKTNIEAMVNGNFTGVK